jgi:hypothetical protein
LCLYLCPQCGFKVIKGPREGAICGWGQQVRFEGDQILKGCQQGDAQVMLVVVCEVIRGYFAQELYDGRKELIIIGNSLPNVALAASIRYQRVIMNEVLKKD